ncbi:hypothetical protein [Bacillus sp. EB01]|uniref:hypothetical protein n=1 Tax=Bacillus sp. EB01 TaxID=1347086 RepID=UPI0005C520CB|nr:hypothetical protein [Bacillus sp. EB01]
MRKKSIVLFLVMSLLAAIYFINRYNEKTENKVEEVTAEKRYDNLAAFAKLYGYVRFYHPSDEAAKTDWDRFAVYGSAFVKDARNDIELKSKLEELFSPIAPTMTISGKKPDNLKGNLKAEKDGKNSCLATFRCRYWC